MLTRCWVHADCVQAACERFMKVGFHCGPYLWVDHFPIVEVFYREDVRLPEDKYRIGDQLRFRVWIVCQDLYFLTFLEASEKCFRCFRR